MLLPLMSCQKNTENARPLSALEEKGRSTYVANCIACHNPNPTLDGSIGPAVAGSSLDLITHRVLTRDYPAGYSPKRKTEIMPDFPQLKDDVPGLHAYLNSFVK